MEFLESIPFYQVATYITSKIEQTQTREETKLLG
jgi:hypothetical protein